MACWTRLYHSLVDLGEKDALSQRSQKKVMYTDELKQQLLAHLSQRLTGWAYSIPMLSSHSVVCPPSAVRRQVQTYPKPLGRSKPNFAWSLYGNGEQKIVT